jgi:lysyl-tRNA synthetase class 1
MLLNLAAVANAETRPCFGLSAPLCAIRDARNHPRLDRLVGYAVAYFRDFVKPAKISRRRRGRARGAAKDRRDVARHGRRQRRRDSVGALRCRPRRAAPGFCRQARRRSAGVSNDFFNMLYEVLLGEEGPRFGSFIASMASPRRAS